MRHRNVRALNHRIGGIRFWHELTGRFPISLQTNIKLILLFVLCRCYDAYCMMSHHLIYPDAIVLNDRESAQIFCGDFME